MSDPYNPNSIDSKLTRIETKLDDAIRSRDSHESRITALEKWRYYVLGAFAAAGLGAKAVIDWMKG
jgi:hypothetical protein